MLACLWREQPATARGIREMLKKRRPMAHGSVVTLLTRLERKGIVAREKSAIGKAFLFRTLTTPDAIHRKLAGDFLERAFAGDKASLIRAVLEASPATAEEIAEIERVLSASRSRPKKKA